MSSGVLGLSGWLARRGLGAGWFVVGLLLGSLPDKPDPLRYGFLESPLHLRLALWLGAAVFALALLRLAYLQFRRAPPETAIYREDEDGRISRWEIDPQWRPFDKNLELLSAPNLLEPKKGPGLPGWTASELQISVTNALSLPDELREVHEKWCSLADPRQLQKNGKKYALCRNPFSETDQHFVDLAVSSTSWSEVQAFIEWIGHRNQGAARLFRTVDPDWSRPHKPKLTLEKSCAPQSLCLHGVVLTTDNQLLAIQRPDKSHTDYYPDAWSISFEEQLSAEDIDLAGGSVSSRAWVYRAARQEVLGEAVDRCLNLDAVRLVAVALEEPIFNAFVVALLPVSCDSHELAGLIPHAPDRRECQQFRFLPLDPPFDLVNTIFTQNHMSGGGELHPTSRYRLYLALTAIRPFGGDLLRRAWMQREV